MKNSPLIFLLLSGCALLPSQVSRQVAQQEPSQRLQVGLSRPLIFANGANTFVLTVQLKDDQGNPLSPGKGEIELIHDVPVESIKERATKDGVEFNIMPVVRSPDIRIIARWREHLSPVAEIKTTLDPLREALLPLPSGPSSMSSVSGLSYQVQDNFDPGQYEGFSITNRGSNAIVNAEDSSRDFDFEFEEQARQNMSLFLSDAPNGTVSHTMHSLFMFFPRKILPYAENSQNETIVTLPNGEQMIFKESGEISGGVFTEGPVDIGPDRFKRSYANLKYQGKGVLLRANARGQMPQQGQFESTPIDMDYGIKFSNDVLIINGSTGQRCRRPKKDFWTGEDVSPILFKFPSDTDFDAYLMKNCKFGLPEMEVPKKISKHDGKKAAQEIWNKCEAESDFQNCLSEEVDEIEDKFLKSAVDYEMLLKKHQAKKDEAATLDTLITQEKSRIYSLLVKDYGWITHPESAPKMQQDCRAQAMGLVELKLRFHEPQYLLESVISSQCEQIIREVRTGAEAEALPLIKGGLEANFEWTKGAIGKQLIQNCEQQAVTFIPGMRHASRAALYQEAVVKSCAEFEKNPSYIKWLSSQTTVIEARLMTWILAEVEARAEKRASSCVQQYPVDTQVQRILNKKSRDACLINYWDDIESGVLKEAAQDSLAQAVNLSQVPFYNKLEGERRRTQLRIMKKFFLY